MKTALEVVERAKREQPELKLAISRSGNAIGAWDKRQSRYVMVAGMMLTGDWANMPVEVWINGKPPVSPQDWIPQA